MSAAHGLVAHGVLLRGDEGAEVPPLERVDVSQPALFAMKVALAAVGEVSGWSRRAVWGTARGEIAAALVAGILSLEEGAGWWRLRSQLMQARERQRRDGDDGACGRGGRRAAAVLESGRVWRWRW